MPPLERAVKLLERLEERGDAATVVAAAVRASGREIGKTDGSADVGRVTPVQLSASQPRTSVRSSSALGRLISLMTHAPFEAR